MRHPRLGRHAVSRHHSKVQRGGRPGRSWAEDLSAEKEKLMNRVLVQVGNPLASFRPQRKTPFVFSVITLRGNYAPLRAQPGK